MNNDFLLITCKEYIEAASNFCIADVKGMLFTILMLAYAILIIIRIKNDKYKNLSIIVLAALICVIVIITISKI